jgi:hypothetical protein
MEAPAWQGVTTGRKKKAITFILPPYFLNFVVEWHKPQFFFTDPEM